MELIWYGTASLILRATRTTLAIDPFCGLPIGGFGTPAARLAHRPQFQQANAVLITHGHMDHIFHVPALYGKLPARVYCTETPYRTLMGNGLSPRHLVRIAPGWRGNIGPFEVTAWQGRHCRFDQKLILQKLLSPRPWRHIVQTLRIGLIQRHFPENGETLFYEIRCGAARLQVMGSLNLDEGVDYPTGADALILPLQGRSDLGVYALTIVRRLRPKKIYLDHYDDAFPPISDAIDPTAFIARARDEFRIPCIPLEVGRIVRL